MLRKLLIANRGEIACRVIRTARQMGVRTVAVYSDADETAMHVGLADEAVRLGPAPSSESYLKIDRVLAAAEQTNADAIHPGYGFLSENAGFARRCAEQGIVFVGPPADAIDAMGNKSRAKELMEKADVPMLPGYHGVDQDPERLREEAERIGFPLLIKAAMGGGGKGMRIVESADRFDEALELARGESRASFGDETVLLERFLTHPRHVEVQVFADQHGGAIYLGDRDCSIQRRHQKIIEEAPAPGLSDETRRAMGEASVRAALAIGYVGAGTMEFLYGEDGGFYFMEMNTRLQVEHPVTEMVTGQDLVKWQLLVAGGEPLPLRQEDVHLRGHAIEARIYAEDPDDDFKPAPGRITFMTEPEPSRHVRIDSGVREGDEITSHYDPMIAKLVCWDEQRPLAVRRINRALEEYRIVGVTHNLNFLANVLDSRPFIAGDLSTRFLADHAALLTGTHGLSPLRFQALAALFLAENQRVRQRARDARTNDPRSPWSDLPGWRLNGPARGTVRLLDDEGHETLVGVELDRNGVYTLDLGDQEVRATAQLDGNDLLAELDGHVLRATVSVTRSAVTVHFRHHVHTFALPVPTHEAEDEAAGGQLNAPINGIVVSVLCQEGQDVSRGATLMVVEAMKMQYNICAPEDGKVKDVLYQVGDQVLEGQPLLVVDGRG
ncbi:acetyl-CoA carboxylase biotin carboxylase subunit [bacterium]|nr:acetyl-CoA carboxylase biotin carboxylase subunit [bacterium]